MLPQYTPKDIARFWSKVDRSGGPAACWTWQSGVMKPLPYGRFKCARRNMGAHVVSWELAHGTVPPGLCVCHNCPGGDNPTCVNPAHLFLGTLTRNHEDMVAKGRNARGERNGRAKLTEPDVREIRRLSVAGVLHKDLAARFDVSDTTIFQVVSRKMWGHIR